MPFTLREAHLRHAKYYLDVLEDANKLYLQGDEALLRGLKLFETEWANIQAGQAWASAEAENDDEATQLCTAFPLEGIHVLYLRQHPRQRITWLEATLFAAQRLKHHEEEVTALGSLGLAYWNLGETRRALEFHEQALTVAREVSDRRREGNALVGHLARSCPFIKFWQRLSAEPLLHPFSLDGLLSLGCAAPVPGVGS
jgi:tetratricopeptide (TPR) repeat protein